MAARRDAWMMVVAVLAIVFGVATIRAGGSVLFGSEEARRAAGAYVGFVVWFNFLAGFAYVAAGIGLWLRRRWGFVLAAALAIATLVVFAAFGLHVASGGAWEPRTVGALTLRTVVWAVIAAIAWRRLGRTA
ncbi:MAG: hypothetical protein J0H00_13030 [Burkholderiales bacterium]|nr:hypothetical protein [Burkholderiales bacterium]OJX03789.1 MAG: hypothetical protein BGO72_02550 [Burkholderiales bacterium 70-64]